jgi:hypothetical protein
VFYLFPLVTYLRTIFSLLGGSSHGLATHARTPTFSNKNSGTGSIQCHREPFLFHKRCFILPLSQYIGRHIDILIIGVKFFVIYFFEIYKGVLVPVLIVHVFN